MNYQNPKPRSSWRKPNTSYRSSSSKNTARSTQHIARKNSRGVLHPLLSESEKSTATIQALSYDFACRIVRLYQYLTEDSQYKEYIISKQVVRSGTSIGANVREAQHAQSEADFLSKMSISHKEADETCYWVSLLHDNGYINDIQFDSLNNDSQRIMRLLYSIIKKTKYIINNKRKH